MTVSSSLPASEWQTLCDDEFQQIVSVFPAGLTLTAEQEFQLRHTAMMNVQRSMENKTRD